MKRNVFFQTINKIDVYQDLGQFTFWKGKTFFRCNTLLEVKNIINKR